jgi:hypothetical protein
MASGNTSSSKRLYRKGKMSGQMSLDVQALSGGETFGDPGNLQLWNDDLSEEFIDHQYGYDSFSRTTPNATPENVDGNAGFKAVSPNPAPPLSGPSTPKKGDATPGGGW